MNRIYLIYKFTGNNLKLKNDKLSYSSETSFIWLIISESQNRFGNIKIADKIPIFKHNFVILQQNVTLTSCSTTLTALNFNTNIILFIYYL